MNYDELQDLLHNNAAESDIAEAHGMLCGLLCADDAFRAEDWFGYTLGDANTGSAMKKDVKQALQRVYEESAQQLADTGFGFMPLLPDDDEMLHRRVAALSDWCGGFLQGLAVANPTGTKGLGGDAADILKDFTEITRAEFEDDGESDEDERDYSELLEYVRVSALLIREEFRREPEQPQTLH